jgi:hypothetical protein
LHTKTSAKTGRRAVFCMQNSRVSSSLTANDMTSETADCNRNSLCVSCPISPLTLEHQTRYHSHNFEHNLCVFLL